MENRKRKTKSSSGGNNIRRVIFCVSILIFCAFSIDAQSTDQSFPTPVSSNEIDGRIAARDLGDARLTTFFYAFGGVQGDVFINVKTTNLDGDIDVFVAGNLRPLTKITVFSDAPQSETGRVIYLRKPEKLILRIQGRTPNDGAATFNLKFAGSFAPAAAALASEAPELPEVKAENNGDVIVNSVGTIVGIKPKPTTAAPKETVAANEPPKTKPKKTSKKSENKKTETDETTVSENSALEKTEKDSENLPPPVVETEKTPEENTAAANKKTSRKSPPANRKVKSRAAKNADENTAASENEKTIEPNPLESVRLLIVFKDGTKIERPMSEVLRVGVDKGVLTLITKDGNISRYPILDVAKMTIE